MNKILFMGDNPLGITGFGNQMRNIAIRLSQGTEFEPYYFGWQYQGRPLERATLEGGQELNFKLLPGGRHPWGRDMLRKHLDDIQPSILFVLCDSFMLAADAPGHPVNNWFASYDTSPARVIYYFPSDGDYLPWGCKPVFEKPDRVIAMAKYGKKWLTEVHKWRKQCDYIPHAIDHTVFHPRSEEKINKVKQFYSKLTGVNLMNKRIYGLMARNQGRKAIPELVKAFANFARDKDDVVLFMHTAIYDPASNINLLDLAEREGIRSKIVPNPRLQLFYAGIPVDEMADLYSMFYANCSSSSGEGFGIGAIEAMATGTPNIITHYTTSEEIVGDTGLLVPLTTKVTGTYAVERGFVDKKEFTDALQWSYDHPEEWEENGKKAREKVLSEYTWQENFPKWLKLFRGVLD